MTVALVSFLVLCCMGSLITIISTAADQLMRDSTKVFVIFCKIVMLVWAIALIVLTFSHR